MTNIVGDAPPLPGDDHVQALARGLAVITAFDADHGSMTLSEVAVRAGLTRATARRLLLTLEGLGYVRLTGRHFTLTPQVLRLGAAYLSGMGLPQIAQPHLEALTALIGESTSVAVLDGQEIVYVARVSTTHRLMRAGITVGTRFPAFATSMGRVLLADLAADRREAALGAGALPRLTDRTETHRPRLRKILDGVQRDGWALVDQELEPGLRSLAVPITGRDGSVIAAVNVSMSAADTLTEPPAHLAALQRIARSISADVALISPN